MMGTGVDAADGKVYTVLVSNRGEVARRVIKTCNKLGVRTVAIATATDVLSPHYREATTQVFLGDDPRQYTNAEHLIQIAKDNGCDAVHAGYGFLSENVEFCEAMEAAGVAWLGPRSDSMRAFALKHVARELAKKAQVPVLEGSGLVSTLDDAQNAARGLGYPVLLKATGGGGGMGIFLCRGDEDIAQNFGTSQKQGQAFFGNSGVFVEKYVERARHIEVQIFGDGEGGCIHLGERECSIQRRHQKVLEETPSPYVTPELRAQLTTAATALGKQSSYRSAGTVEFLVDEATGKFYFLEVNTRLQVEHGISELVSGSIDIVEMQLRLQLPGLARPNLLDTMAAVPQTGWAIEVRINGEDPSKDYRPSPGTLGNVVWPEEGPGVRVDTWVESGTEVSPYYDSLLAKLQVHAPTRDEAVHKMQAALAATRLQGVPNNLEFLKALVQDERFLAGQTYTRLLESFTFVPQIIEVVTPGINTSVQDWPGRTGLWHVGVPPSGPMDDRSFRLTNALVGNTENLAGLEFGLSGPTLRFHCPTLVALGGARFAADLDGKAIEWWSSFTVAAGQVLRIGAVDSSAGGVRGCLAVQGGLDVPLYLGSRSTFPDGKFGGYQGRVLAAGDSLPVAPVAADQAAKPMTLPVELQPVISGVEAVPSGGEHSVWRIGVLPGPHADPDYLTSASMQAFYASDFTVHYNSNRLGIRLNGPRPEWVRPDGGEGGSHPSNVHDHVYAIGTINYTGDMPVILMVDGPSLGGFVCAATITSSELWKCGQVRPHDVIRFEPFTLERAYVERAQFTRCVAAVRQAAHSGDLAVLQQAVAGGTQDIVVPVMPPTQALLHRVEPSGDHPGADYRLAGDRYVQVEYGPQVLDLNLRVRVHALEAWLVKHKPQGLVETSPGVRSCMIEYDPLALPLSELLAVLLTAEAELPESRSLVLPSRIVHLPMAFEERWTREAIDKYMRSGRSQAPYLPSNIEYIANNNGLSGKGEVKSTIFDARYLVLGLGDVYLGAPCAAPVDPRHRIVTTKYNPARTFTHEGTVGIGGSYMCIYPMDSPGGYQLVGRTLPIWATFGRTAPFTPDKPWLLEFFDQVQYYEVSESELETLRTQFPRGQAGIRIEATTFDMKEYNAMVEKVAPEVQVMQARQRAAAAVQLQLEEASLAELAALMQAKQDADGADGAADGRDDGDEAPDYTAPGLVQVTAGFTANVWDVRCKVGQAVEAGDVLLVLEAMKMESPVVSPCAGRVHAVLAKASTLASAGVLLVVVDTNQEQ